MKSREQNNARSILKIKIRVVTKKFSLYSLCLILAFLLGCSSKSTNKAVLQTLSVGEFFSHHPLSLTAEQIADDLDSQLVMFKHKPFLVEPLKQLNNRSVNLLGTLIAEELATSLSRRGYIILREESAAARGKASPNWSIESAEVLVGGTFFSTPKRLSLNIQALEPRTNLILATTSASVLRTEEIDHLIKTANRKNLISFERVPIGLLGF